MNSSDRIPELIDTLLTKTRQGALQWQPSVEEHTFRLESKSANVRLSRMTRWDTEAEREITTLSLIVHDRFSRVVEEYRPETVAEVRDMEELYALARGSARKTDQVLEQLLNELQTAGK